MNFSGIIKRKLNSADWILIFANVLPVYGVFLNDWDMKEVFLVYSLEAVIIGFFTLIKLAFATAFRKKEWWYKESSKKTLPGGVFILFFLLHYSLFLIIQLTLFLNLTAINGYPNPNVFQVLLQPFKYLGTDAWLMLSVLLFAFGYEILGRFILDNDYRRKPFSMIMFDPYLRIFLVQLVVLTGGIILAFGAGKLFMLLVSAVKIFLTSVVDYDFVLTPSDTKSTHDQKRMSEQ